MLRQRVRRCRVLSSFAVLVSLFYYTSTGSNDQSSFSTNVHFQGVLKSVGDSCDRHSTIVTAYYNLGFLNKHTEREFNAWNARFFRLSDSMVIFTDSKSLRAVRKARSLSLRAKCSRYIVQELEDTYTANLTDWRKQTKLDPEIRIHKDYLFTWYGTKSWLLLQAYVWILPKWTLLWADSGQFRDDRFYRSLKLSDWFWIVKKQLYCRRQSIITGSWVLPHAVADINPRKCQLDTVNWRWKLWRRRRALENVEEAFTRSCNVTVITLRAKINLLCHPRVSGLKTCQRRNDRVRNQHNGLPCSWCRMAPQHTDYNPVRHIDSPRCLRKTRQVHAVWKVMLHIGFQDTMTSNTYTAELVLAQSNLRLEESEITGT